MRCSSEEASIHVLPACKEERQGLPPRGFPLVCGPRSCGQNADAKESESRRPGKANIWLQTADRRPFPPLRRCSLRRRAVLHQPVDVHANVRRFRCGMRKGDGAIEIHLRFVDATELDEKGTAYAEEMEIVC